MQRSRTRLAATTIVAVLSAFFLLGGGPFAASSQVASTAGPSVEQAAAGAHGVQPVRGHAAVQHPTQSPQPDVGTGAGAGIVLSERIAPAIVAGTDRFAVLREVAPPTPGTATAGRAPPA